VVNTIVVIDIVVRAFGVSVVLFEIDSVTSGWNKFLGVGSDDTSGVEWVGSSLERVCLTSGGIERGRLAFSGVLGGNPELSNNHSTNRQSTSFVGADILDTGQSLNSVHSADESVPICEILRCSGKGEGDDGDKRSGQDRDGRSDSVGSDSKRDVVGETSRGDDNDGNDTGTSE
jgi:hypothetical protein